MRKLVCGIVLVSATTGFFPSDYPEASPGQPLIAHMRLQSQGFIPTRGVVGCLIGLAWPPHLPAFFDSISAFKEEILALALLTAAESS